MKDKEGRLNTYILNKNIRVYNRGSGGGDSGRVGTGLVVFYAPDEFIVMDPPSIGNKEKKENKEDFVPSVDVPNRTIVPLEDLINITILD